VPGLPQSRDGFRSFLPLYLDFDDIFSLVTQLGLFVPHGTAGNAA
jgi:hypothetical protein